MFKSKKANRFSGRKFVPSIIAGDMDILGNLISDGTVDIEGCVQGNVKGQTVFIRKGGRVLGDVQGEVLHIHGQVKGLVKARDVHLYATCRVEGTIMHELLSIEDGAFVDGKFKRTQKNAERSGQFAEHHSPKLAASERMDALQDQGEASAEEDEITEAPEINLLKSIRLVAKD
jgi:cytoskeletal protein CcmA (bactofilin family)